MTTNPKEDNDDANGHRRAGAPDNGGPGGTAGNSPGGPKIPSAAERFAAAIDDAIIADLAPAGPGAGVSCAHPHRNVEAMGHDPCNDVVMVKLHCPGCGMRWKNSIPATQAQIAVAMMTPQFQRFGAAPAGKVLIPGDPPKALPHSMQVGEITGWRAWRISHNDGHTLRSVHMAHHWEPGETMSADVNPTQVKGRHSGIYACKTLNDLCSGQNGLELALLSTAAPVVIGKVALWGDTIEHATGYRAEHAKVTHLEAVLWIGHDEAGLLHDLRLRYGFGDDGHKPGQKVAPAALLPNGLGAPGTMTPMILSMPAPFPKPIELGVMITAGILGITTPFLAHWFGWWF